MSRLHVVVPVKQEGHKSRLRGLLTPDECGELVRLFLVDLLGTLGRAGMLGSTFVVSPSAELLEEATRLGGTAVRERAAAGVNAAVAEGARAAGGDIMVIPSDLPLLAEADVRRAAGFRAAGYTVIAPSAEFNGTNLFAFGQEMVPKLSYDSDSFWNHVAASAGAGERLAVLTGGGVMEDVDTMDDVERLLGAGINSPPVRFLRSKVARRRVS